MIETFAALFLAHILADFIFQTSGMVRNKAKPGVFILHIAIVFALSFAALGGTLVAALIAAGAHLVIDALKTWATPDNMRETLPVFLLDQVLHIASLVGVAWYWHDAVALGFWADHATGLLPHVMLISGAITAIFVGGHTVGLLMVPYTAQLKATKGLENAGRIIGQLERALIFLFLMVGETSAVGFLIAAKSVLRFDTAAQGQKEGEYVIIGTLASFGWALAVGFATQALLEFTAPSP